MPLSTTARHLLPGPRGRRPRLFGRRLLRRLSGEEKNLLDDVAAVGPGEPKSRLWNDYAALRQMLTAIETHRLIGAFEQMARHQARCGFAAPRRLLVDMQMRLAEHRNAVRGAQDEATYVQSFLCGLGIPCYLLKGAYVGRTCYADPQLRPMSDVDVLVPREQAQTAARCLAEAGYVYIAGQELHGSSRRLHLPQMEHPERRIPVELHVRIARSLDLSTLVREFGFDPTSSGEPVLPIDVHLAHRLLDVAKDGYFRSGILPYVDIARLIRSSRSEIRWGRLLHALEKADLRDRAGATLDIFCRHFPDWTLEVPACARTISSRVLRTIVQIQGGGDAFWRCRYTPRWQRRAIERIAGAVA